MVSFGASWASIFAKLMPSGQDVNSGGDEILYSTETFTYKTVDDHEVRADVYRYPDEEIRPAIIWLHPGALIFGSRKDVPAEQVKRYVEAGYVVVAVDHRLAPETKLAAIIEDLMDAYVWIRSEGPDLFKIDPARVVVVGHSAGGYLALMAGFRLEPRPKALVSFYGYGDITGLWISDSSSYNQMAPVSRDQAHAFVGDSVVSSDPLGPNWPDGRPQFYIYTRQQSIWLEEVSGRDPKEDAAWFSAYEPIRNVSSAYPPVLLLHGEKDSDVPFEKSVQLARAFERHGLEYEFITNPDWGHVFDFSGMEDPEVQNAFRQVLSFLEKHVR